MLSLRSAKPSGSLERNEEESVSSYRKLKEEALDRTVWRTGFGRNCGTVVRPTALWMKMAHSQPNRDTT